MIEILCVALYLLVGTILVTIGVIAEMIWEKGISNTLVYIQKLKNNDVDTDPINIIGPILIVIMVWPIIGLCIILFGIGWALYKFSLYVIEKLLIKLQNIINGYAIEK